MLSFSISMVSQEKRSNIAIEIHNKSIKELLHDLEQQTVFKFYYAEQWLDEKPISKSYQNSTIESILNDTIVKR